MRSLFIFVCAASLWAQPEVTVHQLWNLGDHFELITAANPDSIQVGSAGASQTWDYSHLQPAGQVLRQLDYVDPASTPYASDFPNATIAEKATDEEGVVGYTYYDFDNSQLTLLGVGTEPATVVYTDTQKVFEFPFQYQDTLDDTAAAVFTSEGAQVNRSVLFDNVADGWGTLVLPSGSYTCLRVKSTQEIKDSISVSGFDVTTETNTVSYLWFSPDHQHPLLNISQVSITAAGFTTNSQMAWYRDVTGGTQPQVSSFMPHITAPDGGFETTLTFINNGDETDMILTPYFKDGTPNATQSLVLPSNSTRSYSQTDLFSSQAISHIEFSGSPNVRVMAAYRSNQGGASAHLPYQSQTQTNFYIYPGEPDVVFDGMALVNRGTLSAVVTAIPHGSQASAEVITTDLAPGEKHLLVFDSIFPDPPPLIEIQSTQPAQAIFLRGSKNANPPYLYVTEPQESLSGTRWLPHVTKQGAGFETRVLINNNSGDPKSVSLQPYLADGSSRPLVEINIGPLEVLNFSQAELFGAADVSHFSISGHEDVVVSVSYKVAQGLGASAHVHQTQKSGKSFTIFPGERSLVFDGLAIVNLGNSPSDITAELIGSEGQVLETETIATQLAPHAKALKVFDFSEGLERTIRVSSSQNSAVVFLRGTTGSSPAFLYTNPYEVGN